MWGCDIHCVYWKVTYCILQSSFQFCINDCIIYSFDDDGSVIIGVTLPVTVLFILATLAYLIGNDYFKFFTYVDTEASYRIPVDKDGEFDSIHDDDDDDDEKDDEDDVYKLPFLVKQKSVTIEKQKSVKMEKQQSKKRFTMVGRKDDEDDETEIVDDYFEDTLDEDSNEDDESDDSRDSLTKKETSKDASDRDLESGKVKNRRWALLKTAVLMGGGALVADKKKKVRCCIHTLRVYFLQVIIH